MGRAFVGIAQKQRTVAVQLHVVIILIAKYTAIKRELGKWTMNPLATTDFFLIQGAGAVNLMDIFALPCNLTKEEEKTKKKLQYLHSNFALLYTAGGGILCKAISI